jgi:hypothetical protein
VRWTIGSQLAYIHRCAKMSFLKTKSNSSSTRGILQATFRHTADARRLTLEVMAISSGNVLAYGWEYSQPCMLNLASKLPFCFRSIISRRPTPSDLSFDWLLPRTNSGALVQAFRGEIGESFHCDHRSLCGTAGRWYCSNGIANRPGVDISSQWFLVLPLSQNAIQIK